MLDSQPMLEAARIVWTVALAALILALLLTRTFRKLPVFTAYLLATALQAALHWRNMDFAGTWWITWTEALFTLKAASMCEAFWHRSAGMRRRPLWLLALAGIAGGATFLWGRVRADSPWVMAAMVFRHAEAGLLAFGLLCIWVSRLLGNSVVKDYLTTDPGRMLTDRRASEASNTEAKGFTSSAWPTDRRAIRLLATQKKSFLVRFMRGHSWLLCGLMANTLAGLVVYENLPVHPILSHGETIIGLADTDWNPVMTWTYLGAAACYAGWIASLWAALSIKGVQIPSRQ